MSVIEDTNHKIKLLNTVTKIVTDAFYSEIPILILQLITVKVDRY